MLPVGKLQLREKSVSRQTHKVYNKTSLSSGNFGQPFLQGVAHQRPNLLHGVLAGDLAAQIGVEVLRRSASTFPGDGEAVAQDDDAERQQPKGRQYGRTADDMLVHFLGLAGVKKIRS